VWDLSLILIFLVSARSKTKIQFDGCEHASAEQMSVSVNAAAYDDAVGQTPALHSGARLAAKLNAKIILNDTEFNNPGEMSVDDRQLYHEALAATFPATIAVSVSEAMTDRAHQRPRGSFLSLATRLLRLRR
jgi:protein gp37